MSVPPDMMARLKQGQQDPAALPGGGTAGPGGTPMATPQKKEGNKEMARVKVHVAMNMLEAALPDFGAESTEGKMILKTLTGLANSFGDSDTSDLAPAQVMQMFKSMPQMGGGNEMQQKIAQMMKQKQGGGAPQGPPQGQQPQPQPVM